MSTSLYVKSEKETEPKTLVLEPKPKNKIKNKTIVLIIDGKYKS